MEQGHDPLGVVRDPVKNEVIRLPVESGGNNTAAGFEAYLRRHLSSFSPIAEDLIQLFARGGMQKQQKEEHTLSK